MTHSLVEKETERSKKRRRRERRGAKTETDRKAERGKEGEGVSSTPVGVIRAVKDSRLPEPPATSSS